MPKDIVDLVPEEFYISTSESGWMTSCNFFEFIANVFLPWVKEKNVHLPVILFLDGHSTHMTLQVSTFCEENNIILYLLPPNTTHILQPADVVPFKNLKSLWRQAVHQFQLKNPNQVVRRKDVAVLLKSILNEITSESIKSGFRVTGLYPFNVEAVDFTKCLDIEIEQDPVSDSPLPSSTPSSSTSSEDKYQNAMAVLEELIGIDEVKKCKDGEVCSVTMNEYFNLLNKKCNPDSNTFNEILLENIPIIDIGSSNEEVIDIQIINKIRKTCKHFIIKSNKTIINIRYENSRVK